MRRLQAVGALALAVVLLGALLWAMAPAEPAYSQNTACYMEQGGAKWVCDSGGEFEIRSGATLDVQSGATFNVDGTLDVDGAVTMNSTLDVDGNVSSGTGAFTITDALNVTGATDLDSTLNVDGATTINAATTINNNLAVTGTFNSTGNASTSGTFVSTGNATIGGNLIVDDLLRFDVAGAQTITQDEPITPTVSLWRVTAAGAVSTGSIVAGTLGDVLTIWNSGSNAITISDTGTLKLSADIVLGQYDSLSLISDGTNWIQTATSDN